MSLSRFSQSTQIQDPPNPPRLQWKLEKMVPQPNQDLNLSRDSPESVVSEGEDNTSCSSLEGSDCIINSKTSLLMLPFLMLLAALLTIK